MPGRLFLTRDLKEIAAWMGAQTQVLKATPRKNMAPGEEIIVCDAHRRLTLMRWGMIPVGRVNARGRPVMETIINARSETVFDKSAFDGVARALIPVDGWYEWTGDKRKKTAWQITRKDGGLIAFAGITDRWEAPGGPVVNQVAAITCEPSADVRDIHHRMGVILRADQFDTWLSGSEEAASALMKPFADGELAVAEATDVDWTAP
ncbi:MAG: SOS response-associated peptidase [Paracoccaceae bacterium]